MGINYGTAQVCNARGAGTVTKPSHDVVTGVMEKLKCLEKH